MPMMWPGFKKNCKAYVEGSGKCHIKVSYRYNDFCDKNDCPKMSYAQSALKKKVLALHKRFSKYDWSDNPIVQNLFDNKFEKMRETI